MAAGTARQRPVTAARLRPDLHRLGRRHLVVAALLPLVLLGLVAAMLVVRSSGTSATAVGQVAPDFALTDLTGRPIRLADLRGRPVIVNFWASWCEPCRREFPLLRAAQAEHAGEGLAIVGIVYQDRSAAALDFMAREDATWTAAADPDGRVAEAYGILGAPETFLIGRDGTITARSLGPFTEGWITEKVDAIMEE